jgi:hypothetical protein
MIRLIIQHLAVYDELDVKKPATEKTNDIKTLHLAAIADGTGRRCAASGTARYPATTARRSADSAEPSP